MSIILVLDGSASILAERWKVRYLRTRRKLRLAEAHNSELVAKVQLAEVQVDQLKAENEGLHNAVEGLQEKIRDCPDCNPK